MLKRLCVLLSKCLHRDYQNSNEFKWQICPEHVIAQEKHVTVPEIALLLEIGYDSSRPTLV